MIKYSITNSIISKIENIRSIWGVIENARLVPQWETHLKKIARLRSSVFSTRIEGSRINLEEATDFFEGKDIIARPRDKQELKNYMKVLDYIEAQENRNSITEKDIFKIHALVTKDILSPGLQNKYRDQQNAIYNTGGGIVYMPPEARDVKNLMDQLLNFINKSIEISPLIRAAILHHRFVIVHPFIDGNGRTARALTQLFLYQNGFNTKKYFSLEEYYDNDLKNYYDAIYTGPNFYINTERGIDNTKFIDYFLSGLEIELFYLKKQIESIKTDEKFENYLKSLSITNRQLHFVLFVKENRQVKSKDFVDKFGLSIATIKRELKDLVEKDIIIQSGKGKSIYYELNMSDIGA